MELENRLRCAALKEKLLSAEDAAWLIEDGMTVAVSGFTPAGCPKAVPLALAEQVRSGKRSLKLTLLSGASTGEELDSEWASLGIIARRAPYMTSKVLRAAVNGGSVASIRFSRSEYTGAGQASSATPPTRSGAAASARNSALKNLAFIIPSPRFLHIVCAPPAPHTRKKQAIAAHKKEREHLYGCSRSLSYRFNPKRP